jgi:hypothetical protein
MISQRRARFGFASLVGLALSSAPSRADDSMATLGAAQSLYRKANAHNPKVRASEKYLSYVITSGANWAGPIGTFRLIVDKGDPQTLVSFCGDGVRKIGPTTFEMTAKNYRPRRDIDLLFIETY